MDPANALQTLAAAPEVGGYVNLIKVVVVVVLLYAWAVAAQWVDRDTEVVKTKREQWNIIVLSGGLVAFIVLFAVPWKSYLLFAGLGFWFLLAGGALLVYILHRNGRVVPDQRVLTVNHFKRLMSGAADKRKVVKDKGQRVRIANHKGEIVEFPSDPEEALDYQAVQEFLHDLLWRRASDADLLAGKERFRLVYRIDGVANEQPDGIPTEDGERVFRFLKQIAGVNVEEIRRPQTGKIESALLSDPGDMATTKIQTSGTTAGERMRIHFQPGPTLLRTPELGFAEQREKQLRKLLSSSEGLLLITATPHHGLTTTQYAILRAHDAYIQNIHTLEHTALVDLDNITQRVYDGANREASFARTLQSVLRREPDVVLVGECDDAETARIAATAAAGDRKLYLGMHARDCFEALSKFLAFVDDSRVAAKALIGVVNQRLIRVLCVDCREAFRPDPATLKKLNLPADKIDRFHRPPTEPILDKKGREIICSKCQGSGYVGRTGLFEVMVVDPAVRKLIAENASINKIKTQCRKNKMHYLQEEGLLKVIEGTTSMNEILRSLRENSK